MVKLEEGKYADVSPWLPKEGMNTLFAKMVVKGKIKGEIYTDDPENPTYYYIRHPYYMTLLVGVAEKELCDEELFDYMRNEGKIRAAVEWMQVYPPTCNTLLEKALCESLIDKRADENYRDPLPPEEASKIIIYRRSDLHFERERHEDYLRKKQADRRKLLITEEKVYQELDRGVVPQYFWDSYEDFMTQGMGFTAYSPEDCPVSTAFAAYVIGNEFEIGIETREEFRGQGYAESVCSSLIDYCLTKGYEPVWGCNSGNTGSWKLANKLGFVEVARRPYYRLPV